MDYHPSTTIDTQETPRADTDPDTNADGSNHPLRAVAKKLVVVWICIAFGLALAALISQPRSSEPDSDTGAETGANGDAMSTPVADNDMAYRELTEAEIDAAIDGQVTRLYLAYFDREPTAEGLTYWNGERREGTTIVAIAEIFANSAEFQNRYGQADNQQFVTLVFNNVLDRQPAPSGLSYWSEVLNDGTSRGTVMVGFSDSKEFISDTGTPAPPPPPPAAPTATPVVTTATKTYVAPTPKLPLGYTPTPVTYEQVRGARALDRISYPWRDKLRGWSIHFRSARSGHLGLTYPAERRIEVYVRPDMSDTFLAHVVAHEMGHAVDVTHNSGSDRASWQAARGIGWAPWWPSAARSDFSTGAGDFAEAFAFSQIGSYTYYRSNLASPPSWSQRNLLATLANG